MEPASQSPEGKRFDYTEFSEDIDADGEVLIEVTRNEGTATALRVSSKVLSLASAVFDKMFHSGFKEDIGSSPCLPLRSIPLRDDDEEALRTILYAIHYRGEKMAGNPSVQLLSKIGVLCDKYDFAQALAPWSTRWIDYAMTAAQGRDLESLLLTSYTLDAADMFWKISSKIANQQSGGFGDSPGRQQYVVPEEMRGTFHDSKFAL
ncbi:hypothetical protein B0A55_12140 [Friedmanniomyces simplex]|uniref:BTB domain-containing protein n=1 Tax=Friedmanniomyces simplex TaxID=329884 RepID=A0A4U0WVH0_9PEZI|nr:hypothetical protein B0A55_12140 [Friedmanniomyces simplex]